ncbi:hypothetical protein GCM10007216_28520 [Thalassobacillus devorans]|uniref:Methyltransferase n=1 Tax=Thalassobacillus devorans TaxID=279813 RepID=A0ABQ1PF09_9BACI|nr:DUF1259 domain-containing protein [Thalassobacillus devorans]NIK29358.1 hypothetical protein [Thalassobacillus devorans]GGC96032.1 hypothetical protein GCM10007216_28520 [Thalassobacillus devorans]
MNRKQLCQQFGRILGGESKFEHGVCSVELERDLKVTIQGRPSKAELHAEMMFESLDQNGWALNMGETVILEEEVYPFISILQKNGILVSALHNHWLFAEPTILYLHFQSVEPPLSFAHKVADALRVFQK